MSPQSLNYISSSKAGGEDWPWEGHRTRALWKMPRMLNLIFVAVPQTTSSYHHLCVFIRHYRVLQPSHPMINWTINLLQQSFWWPSLKLNGRECVSTCSTSAQNKSRNQFLSVIYWYLNVMLLWCFKFVLFYFLFCFSREALCGLMSMNGAL